MWVRMGILLFSQGHGPASVANQSVFRLGVSKLLSNIRPALQKPREKLQGERPHYHQKMDGLSPLWTHGRET